VQGDNVSALINWFKGARWRMSLSHCVEALIMQTVISWGCEFGAKVPPYLSWWFGFTFVVAWFWSREKAQQEMLRKEPGTSNADVWHKWIMPWEWDKHSQLDFLFPVLSSAAIAAAVTWLVMR
jgi:hypothetical protein